MLVSNQEAAKDADSPRINVRSEHLTGAEVAWFAPICDDDFEFLGVPDDRLKSTFAHCADVLLRADKLGYRNILCPSSYQVGQGHLDLRLGRRAEDARYQPAHRRPLRRGQPADVGAGCRDA